MLEQIESVPLHTLELETELELVKQLQGDEGNVKAVYDGVREERVGDASFMSALIKCHHIIFAELFDKCSKGKEKYLCIQIEWHKYCSVLLLSQEHKVESVIPKYDGKSSLISLREKWLNFIQKCTQPTRDCNKAMIMLSSVIYDILMRKVHERSLGDKSKEINTPDPEAIVYENLAEADGDDIY